MTDLRLTVSQVAEEIKETVHTVRNWIRDFRPYLRLEKSSGGYNLFNQDALEQMQQIKKYYREQGLSTKQIQAILSGAEKPELPTEENQLKKIIEHLERQEEFSKLLAATLHQQQKMLEESIKRRDEQLMIALQERRERKERKNVPIWKRLFIGE